MSDERWAEIVEVLEQAAFTGEWTDYGDRPALEAAIEVANILVPTPSPEEEK